MIILVGGTKGGGGKTTTAINLAIDLVNRGKEVCITDGDRQRTASKWIDMRSESIEKGESLPLIDCYEKSGRIHTALEALNKKYEYVIADCGGFDSTELRSAMIVSDLFLVPMITEQTDIWSLQDIISVINTVGAFKRNERPIEAHVIASQVDPNPKVTSKADFETLLEESGQEVLKWTGLVVTRRRAFPKGVPLGRGVVEMVSPDRDPKAIHETNEITDYVLRANK